jgi:hypothetical protein
MRKKVIKNGGWKMDILHKITLIQKKVEPRVDLWETVFTYGEKSITLPLKVETGGDLKKTKTKVLLMYHFWNAEKTEPYDTFEKFHSEYVPHFDELRAKDFYKSCKNTENSLKELLGSDYEKIKKRCVR